MSLLQNPVDLLVRESISIELVRPANTPASAPAAPTATPSVDEIKANLLEWGEKFAKGKAAATLKAVRADWQVFVQWCERTGTWALPVAPKNLLQFLTDQVVLGKKRSTIDRYVNTIRHIHKGAGLSDPTLYPHWKLDWQGLVRRLAENGANAPRQAAPLRSDDVESILTTLGNTPLDLRDAAMIALASDTMCRESELAQLRLADFTPAGEGWSVDVRKSKNDQEGLGTTRYCSPDTKARIDAWCAVADIKAGYLFLPIGKTGVLQEIPEDKRQPIGAVQVARILRRRSMRAGLPNGGSITGHSARVGSAVDLLEAGFSVTEVQYAGGWKGERQVLNYGKTALAGRNAMAKMRKARSRRSAGRHD